MSGCHAALSDKSLYLLNLLIGDWGGNTRTAHRAGLTFWTLSVSLSWQAPKWL